MVTHLLGEFHGSSLGAAFQEGTAQRQGSVWGETGACRSQRARFRFFLQEHGGFCGIRGDTPLILEGFVHLPEEAAAALVWHRQEMPRAPSVLLLGQLDKQWVLSCRVTSLLWSRSPEGVRCKRSQMQVDQASTWWNNSDKSGSSWLVSNKELSSKYSVF